MFDSIHRHAHEVKMSGGGSPTPSRSVATHSHSFSKYLSSSLLGDTPVSGGSSTGSVSVPKTNSVQAARPAVVSSGSPAPAPVQGNTAGTAPAAGTLMASSSGSAAPIIAAAPVDASTQPSALVALFGGGYRPAPGQNLVSIPMDKPIGTPSGQNSVPADPDATAVTSITNAMKAAGISTDGTDINVHHDTVYYFGGTFVDNEVTVGLPGGQKVNLSEDLLLRNPAVAAGDIARALAHRA